MIEKNFEEAFTPEWTAHNITDQAHQFVILREIIPWQKIVNGLAPFYSDTDGRTGVPLRTAAALLIVQKFRQPSDRETVNQVRKNRYIQYFCNVPDKDLPAFIPNPYCIIINNVL